MNVAIGLCNLATKNATINPHPIPDLSRIDAGILHGLIVLQESGTVPARPLRLAGIPSVHRLEAELQRRLEVASR